MQNTPQSKSLDKIFAAIAANTAPKTLKVQRQNAAERNALEVVEACDRRLAELAESATADSRSRRDAAKVSAKAATAGRQRTIRYRGAFRKPLTERLRNEPGRCLLIWLPLAKKAGRKDRGRVAGAIRLDEHERIIVENLDRGTQHSSLSNLRADYEAEGGGTDSWGRFETADGTSIAKSIGVDPAEAHESLGD
ncbi:hypothetical protein [Siccirubricoccus sp. G192]|uniref:hypothetical protein n=1 Tax=Siccirubricoccus sp. G192 TaxID=2849651 RepID=UPI001C2C2BC4|nr:hypothetical protein [Siccirubricoccus sp. G192]MBV1800058.1 hypothetical protein [Siccirubricoccus sp. G192]